jgi:hypothetical protein
MRGKATIVLAVVLTTAAVGQIILSFVLYHREGDPVLRDVGWAVLGVSAIFGNIKLARWPRFCSKAMPSSWRRHRPGTKRKRKGNVSFLWLPGEEKSRRRTRPTVQAD